MLDTFCAGLSDEAQLKIALRLGKIALPVWENYMNATPVALIKVNELIGESNRIQGGAEKIDIDFPRRALEKIERSLAAAKENRAKPVPTMKSDATLSPMLATCMQPLTNQEWDNVLPQSIKLTFTMVFNILIWILQRRRTPDLETDIYVAINQAADVIMRESIMTVDEIQKILDEYEDEKRGDTEESDWENAFRVGRAENLDTDDVYRLILGEKVNKNQAGTALGKEILRQMREEGKSFWDSMEEYLTGTSQTYSYDTETNTFKRHDFDAIVGSFSVDVPMTEGEMLDFVSRQSLHTLRECGFEV